VILAVEDDPTVRTFIVSTLERSGYRVLVAGTPAEAVALSEGLSERIDLLLSDVVMPGQTGHDLAGRLLAGRPELRVLLISGYDVRHAAPDKASLEFLAKPLDPSRLLAAVERALAGHG
jgi:two-component system cell cycle sensor histidine kinase/response regulator CckA